MHWQVLARPVRALFAVAAVVLAAVAAFRPGRPGGVGDPRPNPGGCDHANLKALGRGLAGRCVVPPPPVPTYQVRGSATGVQGLPGAQLVGINGAWCEPGDEVLPGTVLDVSLLFPGNTLPKVSIYSEDLIRDSGETPPRQGVALTLLVDGEHAANVVPVITCRDMTP